MRTNVRARARKIDSRKRCICIAHKISNYGDIILGLSVSVRRTFHESHNHTECKSKHTYRYK